MAHSEDFRGKGYMCKLVQAHDCLGKKNKLKVSAIIPQKQDKINVASYKI